MRPLGDLLRHVHAAFGLCANFFALRQLTKSAMLFIRAEFARSAPLTIKLRIEQLTRDAIAFQTNAAQSLVPLCEALSELRHVRLCARNEFALLIRVRSFAVCETESAPRIRQHLEEPFADALNEQAIECVGFRGAADVASAVGMRYGESGAEDADVRGGHGETPPQELEGG